MSKYLIFRTDRIGDFITSQTLINSIKKDSKNNVIDIVVSRYNHEYIKNFKYINKLYIFDNYKNRFLNFLSLFLKLKKKYDYLIVLDGKRRSFLSSLFVKSKKKICFMKNFYPKTLIYLFNYKYIKNSELNIQKKNFEILANYIDIKIPSRIDYYHKYLFKKNKIKLPKSYIHLHLDEKWFEGYYHYDFDYMKLSSNNIYNFIKDIILNSNQNLIITEGNISTKIMLEFKKLYFKRNKKNNYIKINDKKAFLIENTDFRDLENIVRKSKFLICCEGAISHVSHSFNKKTILLFQKNNYNTANFWTGHMDSIYMIERGPINRVKLNILQTLRENLD